MNEAKLAELLQNEEFLLKIVQLKTTSAVQEAFKQEGLDISEDEVYELGKMLKYAIKSNKTELSAEELEEVAGGGKGKSSSTGKTVAKVVAGVVGTGFLVTLAIFVENVSDYIQEDNTMLGRIQHRVQETGEQIGALPQPSLWTRGVRESAKFLS